MVSQRRLERLNSLIKARIAEIVQREMKDPRIGFVTITRVELDREIEKCKVYWSVLGEDSDRKRSEAALQHARKFIQHEVAEVLTTRSVPRLEFHFDESIAGSIRIQELLEDLVPEDPEEDPE